MMKRHQSLFGLSKLGLLLALVSVLSAGVSGDGFAQRTRPDSNAAVHAVLAISVPLEDVGSVADAGGVNVLYSSPDGLSTTGSQWFDQNSPGMAHGAAEDFDHFGDALAVGDLNGDGHADLVAGVPDEDVGPVFNAGGVNVLYGSPAGLLTDGSQWFDQNTSGMAHGAAEAGDWFGYALAVGDLNGDGYADLAVGVPTEDVGSVPAAGGVNVLYGSPAGLSTDGSQWFDQSSPGMAHGSVEKFDCFGYALAVGDLNGDGYTDLAVGVPTEDVGSVEDAGGVNVLYGSPAGLSTDGSQWFDQNTPGMAHSAVEYYDEFGSSLAVGDLNGDGYADLAVGVPDEAVGSVVDAGGVNILYGSPAGLSTAGSQWFDQNTSGMAHGAAETNDRFGYSLAVGDVNSDGYTDLAVGVPTEDVGNVYQAGGVNVLYGSPEGLSTGGSQWFDQDSPGMAHGAAEVNDGFGRTLAVGDLNSDGYADLAVGVPSEDVGSVEGAGGVMVLFGSPAGLSTTGSQWFDRNSPGMAHGFVEEWDYFGSALAIWSSPSYDIFLPVVLRP
jgi:hypothetical protein